MAGTKATAPYRPWYVWVRRMDWQEFVIERTKSEAAARAFAAMLANEVIKAKGEYMGDFTLLISADGQSFASARGTKAILVKDTCAPVDPKKRWYNDRLVKEGNSFRTDLRKSLFDLSLEDTYVKKGRKYYLRKSNAGDGNIRKG